MSDHDENPAGAIDSFASLFGPDGPVIPRAAFADQLQRRVRLELENLVSNPPQPTDDAEAEQTPMVVPATMVQELVSHGSLFYFTMPGSDVERSGRFFSQLFGWDLHQDESGYHVASVYPPMGLAGNESPEAEVWIEVTDIQASVDLIRSLGGEAEDPVRYDSGWASACRDPQGVRFNLSVPRTGYRQPARRSTQTGELFYWTLPAPDADQSRAFFAEVFGWEFGEPGEQGGMHVSNRLPDGGLGGGREGAAPELFFRVDDLDQAMDQVRALGGTAEPAGEGPEGRHALCRDDQGVVFGLSEPAANPLAAASPEPAAES